MRGIVVFIVVSLVCTSGLGQSDLSPKAPPLSNSQAPPRIARCDRCQWNTDDQS